MSEESNGVPAKNGARQRAWANLNAAIDEHRRFPKNVFGGDWSVFFFFDSDWIFDAQFVQKARELLEIEDGKCVCITDLDAHHGLEGSSFFIEKETIGSDFQSFLNDPSIENRWVSSVDRFGCTSDKSKWCIYCEKRNEIAVIAVRDNSAIEKYWAVVTQFKALPIDQAIVMPVSYGFSEQALSSEWRDEFLKQYE